MSRLSNLFSRTSKIGFAVATTALSSALLGQVSDPCVVSDYKILGPSIIALKCPEARGGTRTMTLSSPDGSPVHTTIAVLGTAGNYWLIVGLSGPDEALSVKRKYQITMTYSTVDGSGKTLQAEPSQIPIDPSGTVSVAPLNILDKPRAYRFSSHVGFVNTSGRLQSELFNDAGFQACGLEMEDYLANHVPSTGRCNKFTSLSELSPSQPLPADLDPSRVGLFDIDDVKPLHGSVIPMALPKVSGMRTTNVLGVAPKIDPKARISPESAPATKEVSQIYINLMYTAGVGTAPGWVLDGKVAPLLFTAKEFVMGPSATANVGGNKVSGQTYTNTIDLGVTAERIFQVSKTLPLFSFSPSIIYETDKQFDRENLLGRIDCTYYFSGFYQTQSKKTLRIFYDRSKARAPKQPPLQLADIRPPLMGFAIDFHTGFEGGGALADTTVAATTGKATITLPSYGIARIVPQVHALVQLWKFSVDSSIVGRYLLVDENTVVQTKNNLLYLEAVSGWKGIGTIATSFANTANSHFGVTVTYKNGFSPPTYARINAIQAGLLIKY
jgi:hypothetical protein